ncbi:MAG: hypothetical protein NWS92_06900 [Crocinitomicaceae bacterium]|jgi:hypothetical protein|nr:hypothetical protein [Crocinitomicaceae bacterium]MDP4723337.1 hypothetical protein [Crocinitomicaceae bacterium]MDP4740207.1 hypothetical protein [Crocinitomicaceae bacterium]MDP4799590.1 hypothetical protein [Crocinitomicaceae bacterium]MDP4807348.1 hypothetical protein [Crocinitomicaceae bacterium]
MKVLISTFVFLLTGLQIWAQQGDNNFTVYTITNQQVEPATRILENPKIIDSVKATAVKDYPLLFFQAETKILLDTIEAATVETSEKLAKLYPFYVKAGIGSVIMPLGEIYYTSDRSRNMVYGAHLKHLSSFGDIKDRSKVIYAPAQYDRSSANAYFGLNERNYQLKVDANYNNNGFHYYGIPDSSISADSIAQRFHLMKGAAEYVWLRGDSARLNLSFQANYQHFLTLPSDSAKIWRSKEDNFAFKTRGWYNYKNEHFYADLGLRYNGYKRGILDSVYTIGDTGFVVNNNIIDFKPGVWTQALSDRLKVELGVTITADISQTGTDFFVYPNAEFKYAMFNNIFIPYIGLRGGLKQNTLQGLAQANPFIRTNIALRNEHNPYDIYAGFKGSLSKTLSFNIGVHFLHIENKAFFVTDTVAAFDNYLTVIYDTLNQTTFEGAMSYQAGEKLKIDVLGRYNMYQLYHNAFAWNQPVLQFTARGAYNLYDKFYAQIDANVETGRKALVRAGAPNAQLEGTQSYVDLGTIVDVNLGLEYRYTPRVSLFLQANNLAAQRYNRWYSYPVQPFQVMGGITARF